MRATLTVIEKWNPDQPRVPAGSPEGGEWSGDGHASSGWGDERRAREAGEPVERDSSDLTYDRSTGEWSREIRADEMSDAELDARAVEKYGTTDDIREAGYIQADGTMLDFSGKIEGGSSGMRAYDHREIRSVYADLESLDDSRANAMDDYIARGNLRVHGSDKFIMVEGNGAITGAQVRVLMSAFEPGISVVMESGVEGDPKLPMKHWEGEPFSRAEFRSRIEYVLGDGPNPDDFEKFNPDQPRVPAGSPEGGQWTDGDWSSLQTDTYMRRREGPMQLTITGEEEPAVQGEPDWFLRAPIDVEKVRAAEGVRRFEETHAVSLHEHGLITDAQGRTLAAVDGDDEHIHIEEIPEGAAYLIHNHPNGVAGLSPEDVATAANQGLDAVSAVTAVPTRLDDGSIVWHRETYTLSGIREATQLARAVADREMKDAPEPARRHASHLLLGGAYDFATGMAVRGGMGGYMSLIAEGVPERLAAKLSSAKAVHKLNSKFQMSSAPDYAQVLTLTIERGPREEPNETMLRKAQKTQTQIRVPTHGIDDSRWFRINPFTGKPYQDIEKAMGWSTGFARLFARIVKFNPDQPRVPAGSPEGGQWSSDGTASDIHRYAAEQAARERGLELVPDREIPVVSVLLDPRSRKSKVLRDNDNPYITHATLRRLVGGMSPPEVVRGYKVRATGEILTASQAAARYAGKEDSTEFFMREPVRRGVAAFKARLAVIEKYDPDQPRVPAGNPDGGQWTAATSAGGVTAPDVNYNPLTYEFTLNGVPIDGEASPLAYDGLSPRAAIKHDSVSNIAARMAEDPDVRRGALLRSLQHDRTGVQSDMSYTTVKSVYLARGFPVPDPSAPLESEQARREAFAEDARAVIAEKLKEFGVITSGELPTDDSGGHTIAGSRTLITLASGEASAYNAGGGYPAVAYVGRALTEDERLEIVDALSESGLVGIDSLVRDQAYRFASEQFIGQWATSASDDNSMAWATQIAFEENLGVASQAHEGSITRTVHLNAETMERAREIYEADKAFYDSAVRSTIADTQLWLQSKGFAPDDKIVVYRGFKAGTHQPGVATNLPNGIVATLRANPVGSWTVDPDIAFGKFSDTRGTVLAAEIPARQIVSSWATGLGCANEQEIVVSAMHGAQVRVIRPSDAVAKEVTKASEPIIWIDEPPNDDWPKRTPDRMEDLGIIEKFDPDQPREPAGTPIGGRWTSAGVVPASVQYDYNTSRPVLLHYGKPLIGAQNDAMARAEKLRWKSDTATRSDLKGSNVERMSKRIAELREFREITAKTVVERFHDPRTEKPTVTINFSSPPSAYHAATVAALSAEDEALYNKLIMGSGEEGIRNYVYDKWMSEVRDTVSAKLVEMGLAESAGSIGPSSTYEETSLPTFMYDGKVADATQGLAIFDALNERGLIAGDEVVAERATRLAQTRIDQWAQSASDADYQSWATQIAFAEATGVSVPMRASTDEYMMGEARQLYGGPQKPVYDAIAAGSIEDTQAWLRQNGIGPDDTITVYRGFSPNTHEPAFNMEGVHDGDTVEIIANPASSWTVDFATASEQFAHAQGYIMAADVPAKNIIGSYATSFGCASEHEVIVGGMEGATVRVLRPSEAAQRYAWEEQQQEYADEEPPEPLAFGTETVSPATGQTLVWTPVSDNTGKWEVKKSHLPFVIDVDDPPNDDWPKRTPDRMSDLWIFAKYDPDQPREPAGSPEGGQWTDADGVTDTRVVMPGSIEGSQRVWDQKRELWQDANVRDGAVDQAIIDKAARPIEDSWAGQQHETMVILRKDGSVLLRRDGNKDSVGLDYRDDLRGAAFLTHNHPSGSASLSNADVGCAAGNGMDGVRAVSVSYKMVDDRIEKIETAYTLTGIRQALTNLRSYGDDDEEAYRRVVSYWDTRVKGHLDFGRFHEMVSDGIPDAIAGRIQQRRDIEKTAREIAEENPKSWAGSLRFTIEERRDFGEGSVLEAFVEKREQAGLLLLDDSETWINPYTGKRFGEIEKFNPDQPRVPAGNPDGGQWTDGAAAMVFVSQNIEEGLDWQGVRDQVLSRRNQAALEAAREVGAMAGLGAVEHAAVGVWGDGREPSIILVSESSPDFETVRAVAAENGLLFDQKASIAFREDPDGEQAVYRFEIPDRSVEEASTALHESGVEYHTLVPKSGNAEVWVYATGGLGEQTNVEAACKALGGRNPVVWQGRGEFLGDTSDNPSRVRARAEYREVLAAYLARTAQSDRTLWEINHDRWSGEIDRVTKAGALERIFWAKPKPGDPRWERIGPHLWTIRKAWDESLHPREPAGIPTGGRWVSADAPIGGWLPRSPLPEDRNLPQPGARWVPSLKPKPPATPWEQELEAARERRIELGMNAEPKEFDRDELGDRVNRIHGLESAEQFADRHGLEVTPDEDIPIVPALIDRRSGELLAVADTPYMSHPTLAAEYNASIPGWQVGDVPAERAFVDRETHEVLTIQEVDDKYGKYDSVSFWMHDTGESDPNREVFQSESASSASSAISEESESSDPEIFHTGGEGFAVGVKGGHEHRWSEWSEGGDVAWEKQPVPATTGGSRQASFPVTPSRVEPPPRTQPFPGSEGTWARHIKRVNHPLAKGEPMEKSVDFEIEVNLLKVDPNYADQRIAYGWAWVSEEGGNLYFDDEGDAISEADLEKAFHEFVLESRAGADYHGKDGKGDPRQVSRLVECVVLTKAKQAAMGVTLPNGRVGAWVGFYFDDDETWSLVKSGEYRSFSIGGAATRVPVEKYDPDQPRDDFGRWTDTGGGFGRTEERLPGGHFQGSDTRIPPVRLKPLYAGGYEVVEDSDTFGGRNFGTIEERGGLWAATDGIGEAVGEWGSKQTAAMMAAQSTLRRGKG